MVLTTALGIYLALREDSIVLAAFAGVGAYLVPTLFDPIEGNALVTFAYLALVNAMIFFLAVKKQWKDRLFLSLGGHILITGTWMAANFAQDQWPILTAYNTLFVGMTVAAYWLLDKAKGSLKPCMEDKFLVSISMAFSALVYYGICLQSGAEDWKGLGALVLGLLCLTLSSRLRRSSTEFLYTGLLLVVAAAPMQFELLGISVTWSILMLAGVLYTLRNNRVEIRYTVYALATLNLCFILQLISPERGIVWDDRTLAEIPFILGILFMTGVLLPKAKTERETNFLQIAFVVGNLMVLSLVSRMWKDYTSIASLRELGTSGVWAVYAAAILAIGAIKKIGLMRKTGVVILAGVILKVFLSDSQNFDTLYKFFAYFGLGFILLIVGFNYERHKKEVKKFVQGK